MPVLLFSEKFEKSFSNVREEKIRRQIWNKIVELETRAPLGKKLKGSPFWSVRVNKYRIIYQIKDIEIIIADILERKHNYREL